LNFLFDGKTVQENLNLFFELLIISLGLNNRTPGDFDCVVEKTKLPFYVLQNIRDVTQVNSWETFSLRFSYLLRFSFLLFLFFFCPFFINFLLEERV